MTIERIRAADWFRVRAVADGISRIDEPFVKEFYRCNLWHVRGRDRDLLIDSGMGVVSLREHVALVCERELLAVASHTHFDHIGGHFEFSERLVHANEAPLLACPTRAATLADPYLSDEIFTALPPAPYESSTYHVRAAAPTRLLSEGDVIDLGDRHFSVLHTPGHSPGGIALWEARSATLFSGDIVYDGPLVEDAYHSNLDDYARSLRRLLALPVRVVHGGHFPSYGRDRHRAIIRDWLTAHER